MTSYITINNSEIDPDSPITADLMTKLRDNPIAISEGASGTPLNSSGWHPYDSTVNGTGTGTIYSFAVNGAVSSVESPTFTDGYEYRFFFDSVSNSGTSTADFQIELFRETSGSYGSASVLFSSNAWTGSSSFSGELVLLGPRRTQRTFILEPALIGTGVTALSVTKTAVIFSVAQKVSKARFSGATGNFDAGLIYMYRRRLW